MKHEYGALVSDEKKIFLVVSMKYFVCRNAALRLSRTSTRLFLIFIDSDRRTQVKTLPKVHLSL